MQMIEIENRILPAMQSLHTYTSGSNMFLIFRHGVGLMTGGFTADWKFSNAKRDFRTLTTTITINNNYLKKAALS